MSAQIEAIYKKCRTCSEIKISTSFSHNRGVCKPCRSIHQSAKNRQKRQERATPPPENAEIIDLTSDSDTSDDFDEFNDSNSSEHDDTPNESVYLLTSTTMKLVNRFKVGKHTGTKKKLISRYKTYFPDVEILRMVPVKNSSKHEKIVHQLLEKYRFKTSEWFDIGEHSIINIFDDYFDLINDVEKTAVIPEDFQGFYYDAKKIQELCQESDIDGLLTIIANTINYARDNFEEFDNHVDKLHNVVANGY